QSGVAACTAQPPCFGLSEDAFPGVRVTHSVIVESEPRLVAIDSALDCFHNHLKDILPIPQDALVNAQSEKPTPPRPKAQRLGKPKKLDHGSVRQRVEVPELAGRHEPDVFIEPIECIVEIGTGPMNLAGVVQDEDAGGRELTINDGIAAIRSTETHRLQD